MQRVRTPYTNFAFGEVSPSVKSRTDTPIYQSSALKCSNVVQLPEGGLKRRYGTKRLYDFAITKDVTKTLQSKLFSFIFQSDERYIVSIEDARVRVFQLTASGVTLVANLTQDTDSDALPFDHDFIHEYTAAQYGDVMIICHPLFAPRQLVRTGLTNFEVRKFVFDQNNSSTVNYQPYTKFSSSSTTLALSGTTGSVTMTCSEDLFTADHVGTVFQYGDSEVQVTAVTNATTATGTIAGEAKIRLEILNPIRTIEGQTTLEITHLSHGFSGGETITIEDSSAVGGVSASNINGSRTIGAILDENTYTVTGGATATDSADGGGIVSIVTGAATRNFAEQAFSAVRGYPAAVCFHENRLVFGGTISQPDAIWMSRTGLFYNFDIGDASDSDAINLVAGINVVHEIRYLVSNKDLQIFSSAGELYVPIYLNQAITPTNAQLRQQTPFGCEFVDPVVLDSATLYHPLGGTGLREYIYTDDEDAYTSTNVSSIASHLPRNMTTGTVINGGFNNGESYALFTTKEDRAVVFTSNRAERRAGFTRFESEGTFYSICAVDDRLFCSAWFDTGSGEELILAEFLEANQLDCAKTYALTAGVADVSADFANGTEVHAVVARGTTYDHLGTFTVTAGEVDLSAVTDESEAEIGFAFYVSIDSLPIDQMLQTGPQTGEPRGIILVVADLVDTRNIKINEYPVTTTDPINGKREVYVSGYERDPQVIITQDLPLPFQLNGFVAEVVI